MAEVLSPPLSGIAQERFVTVGRLLSRSYGTIDEPRLKRVLEDELKWTASPVGQVDLGSEGAAYRASVRALLDLVRIGWRTEIRKGTVELLPPPKSYSRLLPDQIRARKDETRRVLWPLVADQLRHPEFRKFVRRMEQPSSKAKTETVLKLICSDADLFDRLQSARALTGQMRAERLDKAVLPYLQLVADGERDEFTGLLLSDVWRYFRATWAIPNLPIPGRSLQYLIRDRAHPHHAVMGIIAFNNAPMRKRSTDDWVGWSPSQFRLHVLKLASSPNAERELKTLFDRSLAVITKAIDGICIEKLATEEQVASGSKDTCLRLMTLGEEFDRLRARALKEVERQNKLGVPRKKRQPPADIDPSNLPPLRDDLPDMEKATPDPASRLARRLLIAKKRAYDLSLLLDARRVLIDHRSQLEAHDTAAQTWSREELKVPLHTLTTAMKSARLSSNLLEVTTCGAIAPYNTFLGGKLAALLCFSPQISADYVARYGREPAIIRSHLANKPVTTNCTLAALVTTSLYAAGSSQYERVVLPAGTIHPDQTELRIRNIGVSSGFGTVQFSTETSNDLDALVGMGRDYADVNSIFGEGPSPKLRKLRAGLDLIGFAADDLLKHHQERIVYGIELWPGCREFLRYGADACDAPEYLSELEDYSVATDGIASFWKSRWLSMRLDHLPSWEKISDGTAGIWKLSDRVPLEGAAPVESFPAEQIQTSKQDDAASQGPSVFERLALSSNERYSERLSERDLATLHVESDLDQAILDELSSARSVVLTGNAGDGKTHMLRKLKPLLPNGIEVIEDATAEMIDGSPLPVLERIRAALTDKPERLFVLCANAHQLLRCREEGIKDKGRLGEIFRSIESQCKVRLSYTPSSNVEDREHKDVTVLDLSLRNPFAKGFASKLVNKLLSDPEVQSRASADPRVGRNYRRLANQRVRERLLNLLDGIAMRGERATLRQLWIVLCRALFAPASSAAGDAPSSWYSEQLFDPRSGLDIHNVLIRFGDPAGHSHPVWDWLIREQNNFAASEWGVDGPPVGVNYTQDPKHWFNSVKRRFYFEHDKGDEILLNDGRIDREFRELLSANKTPEATVTMRLIQGINRLYCPPGFAGDDAELHIWHGLRYHEQPSRAYLAAAVLPRERFTLARPRPTPESERAFGGKGKLYTPDHLMLIASCASGAKRMLKLDHSLFSTILKVGEGLPRHLVPESHIHRVDAFLERIGANLEASSQNEFRVFNAEDGLVTKLTLTSDLRCYDSTILL